MVANDLPTPVQVVQLLLTTSLRSVKVYNADPATLQAFANSNIKVVVGVANDEIPLLASSVTGAQAWVQTNIAAYMPATLISTIVVGNEIFTVAPEMSSQLVPAMINIHTALVNLKLDTQVKVTTPHTLGILFKSYPPSSGTFLGNLTTPIKDLLAFLSQSNAPLMINCYPYFAYRSDPRNVSLNYVLFLPDAGVTDLNTGLHYNNMLDAQLDAVYSAMERLGYHTIPIVISETGWPSGGDPTELAVGVANARTYNVNLIHHIAANLGTPLRPGTSVDAYLFALFNENLKPGPGSERNFGLFNPDQTEVYNVGLTSYPGNYPPSSTPSPTALPMPYPPVVSPSPPAVVAYPPPMVVYSPPPPAYQVPPYSPVVTYPPPAISPASPPPSPVVTPTPPGPPYYAPAQTQPVGKTWCVAKAGAPMQDVINALNYACGEADCSQVQSNGACFNPNTLYSHASYAFNSYYQKMGRNYWNCYFGNTGVITITDPSKSLLKCIFRALAIWCSNFGTDLIL